MRCESNVSPMHPTSRPLSLSLSSTTDERCGATNRQEPLHVRSTLANLAYCVDFEQSCQTTQYGVRNTPPQQMSSWSVAINYSSHSIEGYCCKTIFSSRREALHGLTHIVYDGVHNAKAHGANQFPIPSFACGLRQTTQLLTNICSCPRRTSKQAMKSRSAERTRIRSTNLAVCIRESWP